MKFLAPIARGPIDEAARNGERVFGAIGCSACHTATLTTGPSANPLFNRVAYRSSPICCCTTSGAATVFNRPRHARRDPHTGTVGLALPSSLLHDGSAATIEDAITRHGGEAGLAMQGYYQSTAEERAALLAFLRSL
jgi:CxxC motif-containing protein (DUF1111 family)